MLLALWGLDKTGKNYFAFGAPEPILWIDLDHRGGSARACYKDKQIEQFSVKTMLDGMDAYAEYNRISDYMRLVYKERKYATVVVDTADELRELAVDAYLADQNAKTGKHRMRVSQEEWSHGNSPIRKLIEFARDAQNHLILISKAKPIYETLGGGDERHSVKTGRYELKGYEDSKYLVDVAARLSFVGKPDCLNRLLIEGCGFDIRFNGWQIDNPTWSNFSVLMQLLELGQGDTLLTKR